MAGKKLKTVLFAEVSGRDEFLRAAGPVMGWNGISDCIDRLQRTARSSGGKVVKVVGSELMMLFETPDAAAGAASKMHEAVNALPPVGGSRLSVKVGYHAGPVIEGNDDLLGDTVNRVAALLRQARAGETMTTPQTAKLLTQSRAYSGQVYAARLGERSSREAPRVAEAAKRGAPRSQRMLRLSYGADSAVCWHGNEAVVVGRDPGCGLITATAFSSRRHCTIWLTPDGFRIRDHSSYGTFITNKGCEEIELLNGQEASLGARGWISLGCSRVFATRLLEFSADQ
jgi:class 3 adenylate cyclase